MEWNYGPIEAVACGGVSVVAAVLLAVWQFAESLRRLRLLILSDGRRRRSGRLRPVEGSKLKKEGGDRRAERGTD